MGQPKTKTYTEESILKSEKDINKTSANINNRTMENNIQKLKSTLQELALFINYDICYQVVSKVHIFLMLKTYVSMMELFFFQMHY